MKWQIKNVIFMQIVSCLLFILTQSSHSFSIKKPISFSFSGIYPQSSLKNLVSMTMRLWAEVNELQKNGQENLILKTSNKFAQQVLLLNTALDTTLIDAARTIHECPEYLQTILYDIQELIEIIKKITEGYSTILDICNEKQLAPAASLFILEQIINKMDKITTQGTIPDNLYFALKTTKTSLTLRPISFLNLA